MREFQLTLGVLLCAVSAGADALDYAFGDVGVTLNNRLSTGVAVRMQERSLDLVGKLNVPGQMNLCSPDNCLSLTGQSAPNQRLVDAAGAFEGVNGDDGDLNYNRYDIVAATTKLTSDLNVKWGDFLVRMRGIGFYDPANVNFQEHHNDTRFQPATTQRPRSIERVFAKGVNLLDAYAQYSFDWGGRSGTFSVGNQTIRWGESTLIALNSLSEINPPNAAILRMPGAEINEVFQPVPAILLSTDVVDKVSAEFLYQYGWKAAQPDPRGSFFSDNDLIGGDFGIITLGQFGEDPNRQFRPAPILGDLSSTTLTTYLLPPHEPKGGGQYGVRVNYLADWLGDGTEMGFYFLNYHSRLPYAAVIAADDSCARDSATAAQSYIDCQGYNGTLPRPPGVTGKEPLPADTLKAYLDYPENIQMYGFSFNTTIGSWSLAGEYSYRPNLPLQVQLTDVIFMGLQPAFPAQDLHVDPTGGSQLLSSIASAFGVSTVELAQQFPGLAGEAAQLGQATFPGAESAIPSYLRRYRGIDRVQAHSLIPGYERLHVGQLDLTAIRAISGSNPVGADQIIFIGEAGFTHVLNMPSRDQLQFDGGGLNRTHASPGADGTGSGGVADSRRLNPTQQTSGFADPFSWGVRSITRFEYNDVIFGWGFRPTVVLSWDIKGIAPFPFQNFVEGRKEIVAGTDINITQALSARVLYQWFTGGGRDNTRKDRDNLAFSLAYTF